MQTENKTNPEDKNFELKNDFTPVKLNVPEFSSEPDDHNLSYLFGDTNFKEVNPFVYDKDNLLKKENKLNAALKNLQKAKYLKNRKNKKRLVVVTASTVSLLAVITLFSALKDDKNTSRDDAVAISQIMTQNVQSKTEEIKKEVKEMPAFDEKGFAVYEVKDGDTIESIAEKMNVSLESLKQINSLSLQKGLNGKLIIPSTNVKVHKVVQNDTLEVIAKKYGLTTDDLIAVNKNNLKNPHFLQLEQTIFIPANVNQEQLKKIASEIKAPTEPTPIKKEDPKAVKPDALGQNSVTKAEGFVHVLRSGETPGHLAARYGVSVEKIMLANNITNPERLQIGQKLIIPGASAQKRSSYSSRSLSAGTGYSSSRMSWPSAGGYLSSNYGWRRFSFHKGIDIAAPVGTGIKSAMSGTVIHAGWDGAYGYSVQIKHYNGLVTKYAHCSRMYVRYGQNVSAGQLIASIGSTGRSTGPHLHFEVLVNGRSVDPRKYL